MGERSNTSRGTVGKLLLGFALLVTLVAVITIDDRLHRDTLEEFGLPTGLGDDELYAPDETDYDPLVPILRWDGRDVYRRRRDSSNRADDAMQKVARDDGDQLYFYREAGHQSRRSEARDGTAGGEIYFVKVADDRYLEVGEPNRDAPEEAADAPPPEDRE